MFPSVEFLNFVIALNSEISLKQCCGMCVESTPTMSGYRALQNRCDYALRFSELLLKYPIITATELSGVESCTCCTCDYPTLGHYQNLTLKGHLICD